MVSIVLNFLLALYVFVRDCIQYVIKHVKLKYIFSISTACKLLALYAATVLWIIVFHFQLPSIDRSKPVIALYSTNRIGEKLLYDRVYETAKTLKWNVVGAIFNEEATNFILTKHFYYTAASIVNLIYKPAFNLSVTHYVYVVPYGYNVVYLNVPNNMLFDMYGDFKERYIHLADFDAYVDLYGVMHDNVNPLLLKALKKHNHSSAPIISLYLAQNNLEYTSATRDKALLVGTLWGCNRESMRVTNALQKLADEDLLIAYGLSYSLKPLGKAYQGQVEIFAPKIKDNYQKLVALQKTYGISLVIHNLEHLIQGIPTSRIMESVAAGTIVISDKHPFVQKVFGDSVLYIDAISEEDVIYRQIKSHIEWIKEHPAEVEQKSRNAYEIFKSEWLLENQLIKLYDFIMSKK